MCLTITKTTGEPFYSSEAYSVVGLSDIEITVVATGAKVYDSDSLNLISYGPFYFDPFGVGCGWMWTDLQGSDDLRKGSIMGSYCSDNHVWAWYGRPNSPSSQPTIQPSASISHSTTADTVSTVWLCGNLGFLAYVGARFVRY